MEKIASYNPGHPDFLRQKVFGYVLVLAAVAMLSLTAGMIFGSKSAHADDTPPESKALKKKIIYPKNTELNFEGTAIEGEVRNPGEFYFQHRPQEKFDSLVKRRKNFHQEMLRDVVLSK